MIELIFQHLTEAITIAVSPMPLIGLIVILISGPRKSARAWVLGWFLSVVAMVGLATALGSGTSAGELADGDGINYLAFIMAGLFFWLAVQSFRKKPAPGVQAEEPAWLSSLGALPLPKVFGLSFMILVLNAKNIPIYISMGAAIAAAKMSAPNAIVTALLFAVVASISPLVIYITAIRGGEKASDLLENWRSWLVQNNATVMGMLFLIIGVAQLSKALSSAL